MYCLIYLFGLFSIGVVSSNAEDVPLNITNGPILGKIMYTVDLKKPMYAFLGIPYAETPVRFEMAKPKAAWTKTINCTYDKPQCVQGSDPVVGSEDCLTLSVYSPNLTGSYPVLFWIHGGYFTMGNGSYVSQAPDFIINQNVVFVQIQYRLGVFGFLSTGDSVCPGNLGFKDQVLALKWVQENIKFFGGDPTKVTLGGQSAGAVSASLHSQSPMSQGLYQAMILNSGTCLNLWGLNRRARKTAFALGTRLCLFTLTSKDVMNCLKKQNYTDLQSASATVSLLMVLENPLAGITYGYVEEPEDENAFFTGKSEQRLSEGNFTQVPVLLGFNSKEAIFFGNLTALVRAYFLQYDLLFTKTVPADLTENFFNQIGAGIKIKTYFFGALDFIAFSDNDLVTFVSSDQFERPIWQFALDVSKYVDATYFYQFSHEGPLGGITYRTYEGVGHAEELNYLFSHPEIILNPIGTDLEARNIIVKLWCNFVKNWNPTPEDDPALQNKKWLPVRSGNVAGKYNYFNISSTVEPLTNPKETNIQFWINETNGIYPEYGQGLYDTF